MKIAYLVLQGKQKQTIRRDEAKRLVDPMHQVILVSVPCGSMPILPQIKERDDIRSE